MATNERHKLRLQWAEVELRLDNDSVSIQEVRTALQGLIEKVYRVSVVARRSFKKRKDAAGLWNYWNPNITEEHFPTPAELPKDVELHLHHFKRNISDADATKELEALGLIRENRLPVILAFLESNPDLQREFPIITAATWVSPAGDRLVVYAYGDSRGRSLDLYWDDDDWNAIWRFLVRRK